MSFSLKKNINYNECLFVEPSAGTGSFSSMLPSDSIVMDLDPKDPSIERRDFLTWNSVLDERIISAKEAGKTIVSVGNPPFGDRGWMALAFLNKCSEFSDYCAFLLPMSFASEGKGTPKYRVKNMHSSDITEMLREEFDLPNGKTRKVNVIWQIWERGENVREDFSDIDKLFIIKCIGDFSYRLCGQDFKEQADIFISQGYYPGTPMSISEKWSDILYRSGYGIRSLVDKNTEKMKEVLRNADWCHYSTASTHGCRHVGMTEIKQVLADAFRNNN